jgi:2-iminobutanoate/2-iminopropanoate deaminase
MMQTDRMLAGAEWEVQAPSGFLAAAPLSNAVRVGDLIFISGQIGIGDAGTVVPGGVGEQTRACLQGIQRILESMGASAADVVQTRVFLTDFTGYDAYNRVYREYFSSPFPTRSTVGVSQLALGAEIEIEAVAITRRAAQQTSD